MQLTENFWLHEFTRSQTAARKGIANNPGPGQIEKLRTLCLEILEPTRAHFGGRPLRVTSGYRSPELNRAIGGSRTSQHMLAEAADFEIPGIGNPDVADWIHKKLNYDQLILEFYTQGQPNSGWIHVGYSGAPHKNQELTAMRRGGRTVYLNGLVR